MLRCAVSRICKMFSHDTSVDDVVDDKERVVRFLLSPMHFKKDGSLRSNAFNPTLDTDEVSVSRLDKKPIEQTKEVAKLMASKNASQQNKYFGFALHTKNSALRCGAVDIVPEPTEDNDAHAELKLGIIRPNTQIPAELQVKIDSITQNSKLLIDPDPQEKGWKGEEPVYV